jgi:dihydrofolate synthase / folylpolyglutamate synthase
MTYSQAIGYLFSQLPMYQRIGPAAYKANLDNTLALSAHLNQPERRFPSIHIAGTNGKGSVAHMLASVLGEHGLKTGLATSPHLKDFRERIRINGQMIPKRAVSLFVKKHRDFFEPLKASFFEISIALTFDYFAREQVDMAVVETGLGGRLDSTNILQPLLCIITGIHYDHTALLGNSLEEIAREKAGIIKPGVPVLIGRRQPEIHHVFEETARLKNAPLFVAGDMAKVSLSDAVAKGPARPATDAAVQVLELLTDSFLGQGLKVQCDLTGHYQKENLATALAALEILAGKGSVRVEPQAVLRGLASVRQNTGFAGRWHEIARHPRTICDTAHNVEGIRVVMEQLLAQPHERLHMVIGVVDDKDLESILACLPGHAAYYFCKPGVPRGLDADKLAETAGRHGLEGRAFMTVKKALDRAREMAGSRDIIFVGGSTFVVAEAV